MPLLDTAAMNASLDNDYGTTRGPNAADSHTLALFLSDPLLEDDPTDVEIAGAGYVRATVLPAAWAAAADGSKSTSVPVQFADATAAWADQITHWALLGDDGLWWDTAPLAEPREITAAGDGPQVSPTVFYDNVLDQN